MPPSPQSSEKVEFIPEEVVELSRELTQRKGTEKIEPEEKLLIDQTLPIQLVWRNIILYSYLHVAAIYGLYLFLSGQVMLQTVLWGLLLFIVAGLGVTAGCHRLWSHKSFKAKLPLRIMLGIFQTIALQNSIHEWSRDHRVHHKYAETNADPHNAKRGFFFAHIGWLLVRKHPSIKEKGQGIDLSDLEADSVVVFQKKYYLPLVLFFCFIFPTAVPMYLWGESFLAAWFFAAQFRYCFGLNSTWLVNSAAHLWGARPYDKTINPAENKTVSILAFGEGWHNYHHTFPWDYKTAELGNYQYNWTTAFLDFMARLGLAYDLKTVPKTIVLKRVQRTGDGSHAGYEQEDHMHGGPWGWGDQDIPKEDFDVTETLFRSSDS